MGVDNIYLFIFLVIFLSSFTRASIGFGDALVSMPLLSFFLPFQVATPLVGFITVTLGLLILIKERREIQFKSVALLLLYTLLGLPFGVWLLSDDYEMILRLILGMVLVSFSLFSLLDIKKLVLKSDQPSLFFGIVAGILGGAYNVTGPPIVVYATLRNWSPAKFKATLQGYFLPAGIGIIFGHYSKGLWTLEVINYFLYSLPVVVLGILTGFWVSSKLNKEKFKMIIHFALMAIGVLMILRSF